MKSIINIDRKLFNFSRSIELDNYWLVNNDAYIKQFVRNTFIEQYDNLENVNQRKVLKHKAKVYLKERAPYDFYYIGKKNINNSL